MAAGKTRKSREKLADTLMSMSSGLAVALMAALLIAPMGAVIGQQVKGQPIDLIALLKSVDQPTMGLFLVLYGAAACTVMLGRHSAFKIYDELYPDI